MGIAPITQTEASVNLFQLAMWQKEIKGTIFGSLNPRADIPRLLDLYRQGQLKLDELITRRTRWTRSTRVPAHAGRHQHPWRHRLRLSRCSTVSAGTSSAGAASSSWWWPRLAGRHILLEAPRDGQVDVAAGRGGRARHRLRVRGGERRADAGPARRTLRPGPGDDRRVHAGRLRGRTTRLRAPRRLAALRRGDQPHPGGDAQRAHHGDERGRSTCRDSVRCRVPRIPTRRGDEPVRRRRYARISSAYDRTCRSSSTIKTPGGSHRRRAVGDGGVDEEWREKLVDLVRRTRTHPECDRILRSAERSMPPRRPASRSYGDCRSQPQRGPRRCVDRPVRPDPPAGKEQPGPRRRSSPSCGRRCSAAAPTGKARKSWRPEWGHQLPLVREGAAADQAVAEASRRTASLSGARPTRALRGRLARGRQLDEEAFQRLMDDDPDVGAGAPGRPDRRHRPETA